MCGLVHPLKAEGFLGHLELESSRQPPEHWVTGLAFGGTGVVEKS